MADISAETFTCYICGETLEKDPSWTDQDAAEEYMELFGASCNDLVSACDDCWQIVQEMRR